MITDILSFTKESIEKIEEAHFIHSKKDKILFRYIVWILKQFGSKNIVIESNYVDRDFSEDYSAYYSTLFCAPSKKCSRIHFFSCSIDKLRKSFSKRKNISTIKSNLNYLNESYLGFIVIIPIDDHVIGRTVLSSNIIKKLAHSNATHYYCTTRSITKINIDGLPIKINGMPFIQQDWQVGVCSSTAIWMITNYMSRFGFRRYSLTKITEAANKYLRINRPFPALRGLTVQQIISGFSELGIEPIHYQKSSLKSQAQWNPKEIIYNYIESELPVIAVIGNEHACVIIGHDFNLDTNKGGQLDKLVSNSEFIDCFIVHDDERGPYLLLPEFTRVSKNASKYENNNDYNPFEEEPNIYTPYSMRDITNIIIPVFQKVYLEGTIVNDLIVNLFTSKTNPCISIYKYIMELKEDDSLLSIDTINLGKLFLYKTKKTRIFYRTRFLLSNHFKENYLLHKKKASSTLIYHYSIIELPRYIWLVELFYEDDLKEKIIGLGNNADIVIGEIIIDATGADNMSSIISFHLPGILVINPAYQSNVDDTDVSYFEIINDTPCELFSSIVP